ncbi:MAG: hypothetical protein GY833_10870, partial [Aestuariibacter sp.]|nr:hypothetical protein [Aestuariibacter sp.]
GCQTITWSQLAQLFENQFQEKKEPFNTHLELRALTFTKGKDDFLMFAIDFMNLMNYSNQELNPDQLDCIASRELRTKLPAQWQKELDKLHQEDGRRVTFSYDKEWCLKQQCNEAAFAERKEITKTPAVEEKKDPQQNRAKPTGSVQEIQGESAASDKGRRRKDKKDGADNSVSEPQLQIDNVTYQQTIPSGPQQQRYYLPPPPLPPLPQYFYQDVPRCNLCPWAPDRNTYTNFKSPIYSVPNNYLG